jgi:hypothetical protein
MQGIEVSGMLIWSVNRTKDGPMSCYKYFGEDLKLKVPKLANGKLEAMAVAIIRDRIANLTLDDILKNRSKLRDGIKDELMKILEGWGIWLETCEIMEVKICAKSLFTNLQTKFREQERLKATRISSKTQNIIKEENLVRNMEITKKREDINNALRNEQLERDNTYTKTSEETENAVKLEEMARNLDYRSKANANNHLVRTEKIERDTEFTKKSQDTNHQLKVEEYDRNKQFNDLYEKTNHQVRQENLNRTLEFNKLNAETKTKEKQEQLDRDNQYNNYKTEVDANYSKFCASEGFKETEHQAKVHKRTIEVDKKKMVAKIDK